jgi:hypothetical protein
MASTPPASLLLGQYTASEFVAASDGHGGTLITYASATTSTSGHGHGNAIASPVTLYRARPR